ncbi:MAG: hypothetical protein KIT60_20290 [Burkholderiaceae bacterium]|nr:hypothetical protein [Burkholderiaceae bacterium]
MSHELLNLKYQSHETLSVILMGFGMSAVAVIGLRLYLYWRDRRGRKAKTPVAPARKTGRKRRRHRQR